MVELKSAKERKTMQIDPRIIGAFIGLAGVMITIIISYYTAKRQIKLEFLKIQSNTGGKLYDKRLEEYPAFYRVLSNMIKLLETSKLNNSIFIDLDQEIREWNSLYGIYMGARTTHLSHELRCSMQPLIMMNEKDFTSHILIKKNTLIEQMRELELALKYELGIFEFETHFIMNEAKAFKNYKIATDELVRNRDD